MSALCLIDGNSIGFAAQSSPKLTVGDREVQALFGFLKSTRVILSTYRDRSPVVLWDGKSWRFEHFAGYKAKRSEDPKAVKEKEVYKTMKPFIARALKSLGVPQVMALNYEADDLAGLMTVKARGRGDTVVLISGDKDWLQLVEPGVLWHDTIRDRQVSFRNFHTTTGYVDGRAFAQGKALMGDTSDCIPGVGGIGEKAAPILLEKFGSIEKFWEAYEQPGFELPEELARYRKKLADFVQEGKSKFAFNMLLMDLKTDQRPAPVKMTLTKGAYDPAAFTALCDEFAFHSILRDFDNWTRPFAARFATEKEAA